MKQSPEKKETFRQHLEAVLIEYPVTGVNNLVRSFIPRVQQLKMAKGQSFRYKGNSNNNEA